MKKKTCILAIILSASMLLNGCGIVEKLIDRGSSKLESVRETVSSSDVKLPFIGEEKEELKLAEPVHVEGISYDKYSYRQLDQETQEVYDQVLDCILYYEESMPVSTKDDEVLKQAYSAVMADYGGLFWIDGYKYNTYTYGEEVQSIEFSPKYTMEKEQRDVYQQMVSDTASIWLSGLEDGASDYEKAKFVFEELIDRVDYVAGSENNQNILSAFIGRQTVCQGYASAAWYLLNELGIPCVIVTGTADGEPHAWDLVYLDGAYYYMDVTWGNSKYLSPDSDTEVKHINYAYMAMTTKELLATHKIEMGFEMPECSSTEDTYYVHEGLYFDNFEASAIGKLMRDSYENGEDDCTIKFSNQAVYLSAVQHFIDEQHIVDYCRGLQSIAYIKDDDCNVLTIQWR